MKLSIRDFPRSHPSEAATIPFSGSVDLSELRFFEGVPFPESVTLTGTLRKQHGEVTVEYEAAYSLHELCARCLTEIVRPMTQCFSHRVAEVPENEDDVVAEAPGGILDLQELAASDLLFTLDLAPLCREDCKGICPWCGLDRNESDCDCAQRNKPTDPRLDALRAMLE